MAVGHQWTDVMAGAHRKAVHGRQDEALTPKRTSQAGSATTYQPTKAVNLYKRGRRVVVQLPGRSCGWGTAP